MIYLNQILFKDCENLGICYILYYLDIHRKKKLKSIQPLFLNPGVRLLFVWRSTQIVLIVSTQSAGEVESLHPDKKAVCVQLKMETALKQL